MSKVAVVTGAASGIGLALAQVLVARGDTVVMLDRDDRVKVAAEAVDSSGRGRAMAAVADVRDASAVSDVIKGAHAEHARLDLLVSNAGVGIGGLAEELSLAHWDRAIDVNVRGVIHGLHAAYPLMVEQGFGHILNVASVAGLMPAPGFTPYAMSKHAVVGLSLSLRGEAAARGVNVSVLCPGVVETPILDKDNPQDLPPLRTLIPVREALERFNRPVPADEVARYALARLDRNEAIIVTPRKVRMLWWAYRAAPGFLGAAFAKDTMAWMSEHAHPAAAPSVGDAMAAPRQEAQTERTA